MLSDWQSPFDWQNAGANRPQSFPAPNLAKHPLQLVMNCSEFDASFATAKHWLKT